MYYQNYSKMDSVSLLEVFLDLHKKKKVWLLIKL